MSKQQSWALFTYNFFQSGFLTNIQSFIWVQRECENFLGRIGVESRGRLQTNLKPDKLNIFQEPEKKQPLSEPDQNTNTVFIFS